MFEKVNVDNKAVDYRRALCGVQQINELSQSILVLKICKVFKIVLKEVY